MGGVFSKQKMADETAETEALRKAAEAAFAKSIIEQQTKSEIAKQSQFEQMQGQLRIEAELKMIFGYTARLIANLLCNYEMTYYIPAQDCPWRVKVVELLNIYDAHCQEIFWKMCIIPQMLPLLWPTGEYDGKYQAYDTSSSTGKPDAGKYLQYIQKNIPEYIRNQVPIYFRNVFIGNTYRRIDVDKNDEKLIELCEKYIDEADDLLLDYDFYVVTEKFIDSLPEKYDWRHLYARSRKGVCAETVMLLPSQYPKQCREWNMYEACVIMTNEILNRYGQCTLAKNNAPVPADSKDAKTTGGQCFKYSMTYPEKWCKTQAHTPWDLASFVEPSYCELSEIGLKDEDAMFSKTTIETATKIIGKCDKAPNGYIEYANPTEMLGYQFLNTAQSVETDFRIPPLSAVITDKFKDGWLREIYEYMNAKVVYPNKFIWTMGDFLMDEMLTYYAYENIIVNNAAWNITFPVVDCLSMAKINGKLLSVTSDSKNKDGDRTALPQYIWTHSLGLEFRPAVQETKTIQLSLPDFSSQFVVTGEEKIVNDNAVGIVVATKP